MLSLHAGKEAAPSRLAQDRVLVKQLEQIERSEDIVIYLLRLMVKAGRLPEEMA